MLGKILALILHISIWILFWFRARKVTGTFEKRAPRLEILSVQGSKEVSSDCLGQIDFLAGQLTFQAYLLIGLGSWQVILLTKSLESFRF